MAKYGLFWKKIKNYDHSYVSKKDSKCKTLIDHLFVNNDLDVSLKTFMFGDNSFGSDHKAIVVEISRYGEKPLSSESAKINLNGLHDDNLVKWYKDSFKEMIPELTAKIEYAIYRMELTEFSEHLSIIDELDGFICSSILALAKRVFGVKKLRRNHNGTFSTYRI
jgi:hypothetical protein